MALSPTEQDAMAANCPWCWARPGKPCKTRLGGKTLPRPHARRIRRAMRRSLLGGVGRALQESREKNGG